MAYALRIGLVACLLVPLSLLAQDRSTTTPLTGAWRITEVVRTGTNPVERKTPQPGLVVFTAKHYSIVFVNSNEPRSRLQGFKDPGKPTPSELEAVFRHWEPLTAQAGTYVVPVGEPRGSEARILEVELGDPCAVATTGRALP